jgi:hypothetical protein
MTETNQQPTSRLDLYDRDPAAPAADVGTGAQPAQQPPTEKPQGAAAAAAAPGKQEAAPPAAEEEADDKMVPFKALKEERRKRQDAEAKLSKQFKELEAQVKRGDEGEEQIPDPIVDPEAYAEHLDKRQFTRLVNTSRLDMIDEVGEEEFLRHEEAFKAAVGANPALAQRLWNSRDPARFAFNQGKKFLEQKASAADTADDVVARVKAALEKDYDLVPKVKPASGKPAPNSSGTQPPASQTPPAQPRLPTSLADVQSGSPRAGDKPAGRRSLSEMYGD